MHVFRFLTTLLIIALVSAGCASNNAVKDDFSFVNNPDKGLLAFSTRWDFRCEAGMIGEHGYMNYKLGEDSERVILQNPFTSSDFDNPPGKVHFNVARAGTHVIDAVDFTVGHTKYYLRLSKPVSIPVQAGKINYAGQMTIEVSSCGDKMVRNFKLPDAIITLHITDKWQRDRNVLKEDHPVVMKSEAVVSLMHQ